MREQENTENGRTGDSVEGRENMRTGEQRERASAVFVRVQRRIVRGEHSFIVTSLRNGLTSSSL